MLFMSFFSGLNENGCTVFGCLHWPQIVIRVSHYCHFMLCYLNAPLLLCSWNLTCTFFNLCERLDSRSLFKVYSCFIKLALPNRNEPLCPPLSCISYISSVWMFTIVLTLYPSAVFQSLLLRKRNCCSVPSCSRLALEVRFLFQRQTLLS